MKKVSDAVRDDEAERLGVLLETRTKLSNAEFAKEHGIASGQMVWQYTSGHRPLNLAAAARFANGLGVPISAFSKRLAAELDELLRLASHASASLSTEVLNAIAALDAEERRRVENIVRAALNMPPLATDGGNAGQHGRRPMAFEFHDK